MGATGGTSEGSRIIIRGPVPRGPFLKSVTSILPTGYDVAESGYSGHVSATRICEILERSMFSVYGGEGANSGPPKFSSLTPDQQEAVYTSVLERQAAVNEENAARNTERGEEVAYPQDHIIQMAGLMPYHQARLVEQGVAGRNGNLAGQSVDAVVAAAVPAYLQ